MNLKFAGKLAHQFLDSKLTPLLVIVSLLLGIFAIWLTPKEEEPQIKVPMVDIIYPAPGHLPDEVEKRVTEPLEKALSSLTSIKHLYSTSLENATLITVRFDVGEDLETSLIKVHHKVLEAKLSLPTELQSFNPQIKSYTIDDVPFYTITFYSKELNSGELREKIFPLINQLQGITGVASADIIGGERKVLKVTPDIKKMNSAGISLLELKQSVENANSQIIVGPMRDRTPEPIMMVGPFATDAEDVKKIPIGRRGGKTLLLGDIATINIDYDYKIHQLYHHDKSGQSTAVTLTLSKKKGVNATDLAEAVKKHIDDLSTQFANNKISWEVTRDYGFTAKQKTNELIEHLILATISVMILIALFLGFRVSLVVGITVPVTLALTLMVYYLSGYTLNRVTLFALIFSIGILVDDAIVVVENIFRHLSLGKHKNVDEAICAATDEVGNPTILATFTVIMAIMPMAFVGGLMGPYMRPIPIGASMAMLFSLVIAFIVTPWAAKRLIKFDHSSHQKKVSLLDRILTSFMSWAIKRKQNTAIIFVAVFSLLLLSIGLIITKQVKVKMLPFDNKSEMQVLIDLPAGSTLEETKKVSIDLTNFLLKYKEVKNIQSYMGTAAPFNFSGMVKHTFLRRQSFRADLQINLFNKDERKIQSHDLVRLMREDVTKNFPLADNIKIKFLEIPPGPPVLSTVLAEIYSPNKVIEEETLLKIKEIFKKTEGVVEIDTSYDDLQPKNSYVFNREQGKVLGVPEGWANATLWMAMGDINIFSLHRDTEEETVFMRMDFPQDVKRSDDQLLSLLVPSLEGDKISLKHLIDVKQEKTSNSIYHKDLQRVAYVMSELSGSEESPIYGIWKINKELEKASIPFSYSSPDRHSYSKGPMLKWDGEMEITLEVFKDLGISFVIAIILIMVLIIAWYDSFLIPVIIVLPIPLTLIGIIPGHLIFNSFFTATSMIGFIAGAGITVRNSIILVDFIEESRREGVNCADAAINSTIVRFRPILLTALAVIVAAFVILFDPIFQGLAISLMTGALVSSFLSIPLVPILYYWFKRSHPVRTK